MNKRNFVASLRNKRSKSTKSKGDLDYTKDLVLMEIPYLKSKAESEYTDFEDLLAYAEKIVSHIKSNMSSRVSKSSSGSDIVDQLEQVRASGKVNMMDRQGVREVAREEHLFELVDKLASISGAEYMDLLRKL